MHQLAKQITNPLAGLELASILIRLGHAFRGRSNVVAPLLPTKKGRVRFPSPAP